MYALAKRLLLHRPALRTALRRLKRSGWCFYEQPTSFSDFANMLKTNTSRLLRRDFNAQLSKAYSAPVLWSRSYCVISVGGAPLDVLRRYIEQQARPD